jgi:hypothetical protein
VAVVSTVVLVGAMVGIRLQGSAWLVVKVDVVWSAVLVLAVLIMGRRSAAWVEVEAAVIVIEATVVPIVVAVVGVGFVRRQRPVWLEVKVAVVLAVGSVAVVVAIRRGRAAWVDVKMAVVSDGVVIGVIWWQRTAWLKVAVVSNGAAVVIG